MARFQFIFTFIPILITIITLTTNPRVLCLDSEPDSFSIIDYDSNLIFHQDYSPPAPPPPPPHPPSASCTDDLGGIGSIDTVCQIVADVNLTRDVYIEGKGDFNIHPGVRFHCPNFGCSITINISGNFNISVNSSIVTGTFELVANNASFFNGSVVNTTGLAGDPPPQTSGTPQGLEGAGGGHGGRGACCLLDKEKLPEDIWGGDAYSWSSLQDPWSYGSKGGSTSKEVDYGGAGGGRVKMKVKEYLVVDGAILADGGCGGVKGGGGSGGSILLKAYKMTGGGSISACGGNGFAGGGGGRVSVDIYSRHDDPQIFVHGGNSLGCPKNAGGAGTLYDAVARSLTVSNHNMSTDTDTLLLEFPYQPLWTNVYVQNYARATVPLLWSRVQVQGQIRLLCSGVLSFGLAHYALSEFELFAEELLMSDSVIKVYGALRMSVKMFLMWNSKMIIDGGEDVTVATSFLEASNLVVLKESSVIHSNANLGVHGQGLLNLSGSGNWIEAQRLVLSLFYSIHVAPGSMLRGPVENATSDAITPRLHCQLEECPAELFHPPEDCNVNSSLSFTLQICRVEDITVEGHIEGSVVHFNQARTISVPSSGTISASGMGCTGGVGRGNGLSNGISSGGGHGGKGGSACYSGSCVEGGVSYGDAELPCELGSGSGEENSSSSTAGGGIIVMGSLEHPLSSLSIEGSVRADGESFKGIVFMNGTAGRPGGGSGGTILMFLHTLDVGEYAVLSSVGGYGSPKGGGGGGGGRVHFHWSDVPTGDMYQPIARVNGSIHTWGGLGRDDGHAGENGTVTGKACPKGLYGIFCEECPVGTYKNVTGSNRVLCQSCPADDLPRRAAYIAVRGGIAETPCPYKCVSERFHMPRCYTALEELIYTFGGPWLFCLLLLGVLILLALVLSVARMKFVGVDELPGPAPTQHGSQIDHSFPFLESLNEVLETNRAEESQSHVHRMYFMGRNTFSEPWHLPHPCTRIELLFPIYSVPSSIHFFEISIFSNLNFNIEITKFLTASRMDGSSSGKWLCLVFCVLTLLKTDGASIPLTIVQTAAARGAVCLDGSPPGYHFERGSGSGIDSWLVHMEGGGWCESVESCVSRRDTYKGSSSKMEKTMGFSGILGSKQGANPDFYNWNRIKIRYCDGSSFTGDVAAVDPKTKLYFRGERIWQAVVDDLLAKGMKNARNAILSGCSAGGLAAILHCDKFRSLLPASARVKCVSDAGYFIHGTDISGGSRIESFFGQVVRTHGSAKNLPASCTSKMRPELCFFPQYVAQTMRTPLFVINSAYDSWQIKNILAPTAVDSKKEWKNCKLDLKKCSATQLQTVQNYRTQFLKAVNIGLGTSSRGLWINSCYAHCQSGSVSTWLADKSPVVGNTKMGKAVGDWFYDRSAFEKIDCPYPCNPTCVSVDSES